MPAPFDRDRIRAELVEATRAARSAGREVTAVLIASYMQAWPEHINWQHEVAPLFVERLSDIPLDLLKRAFDICADSCTFRPTIAEIRNAIRSELFARAKAVMLLQFALDEAALDLDPESPPNPP